MSDGEHGAGEGFEAVLKGVGAGEVEVVGGFVKQRAPRSPDRLVT